MTAQNPPDFLQSGTYTAEAVRLLPSALTAGRGGIVLAADLAVTQNGTPNMSVNVAGGKVIIPGTEATYQGVYVCENRGTTNLPITAANATNPRYDIVVAKVQDASYSGATNLWSLSVVTGTAAASPVEPTIPPNSIQLARITVGAAVTTITTANILDRRMATTKGQATALGGIVVTTSGNMPTVGVSEGLFVYQTDTDRFLVNNGLVWVGVGAGTVPAPQVYPFGPLSADGGLGFVDTLSVASALTAPYPLTMHVHVTGHAGFGATGVCRGVFRVVDFAGGTIISHGGALSGAAGEVVIDVSATFFSAYSIEASKDFAVGQTCQFKVQHACTAGSNIYATGVAKVTFTPKVS